MKPNRFEGLLIHWLTAIMWWLEVRFNVGRAQGSYLLSVFLGAALYFGLFTFSSEAAALNAKYPQGYVLYLVSSQIGYVFINTLVWAFAWSLTLEKNMSLTKKRSGLILMGRVCSLFAFLAVYVTGRYVELWLLSMPFTAYLFCTDPIPHDEKLRRREKNQATKKPNP